MFFLAVKESGKSVNIWRSYCQKHSATFLRHRVHSTPTVAHDLVHGNTDIIHLWNVNGELVPRTDDIDGTRRQVDHLDFGMVRLQTHVFHRLLRHTDTLRVTVIDREFVTSAKNSRTLTNFPKWKKIVKFVQKFVKCPSGTWPSNGIVYLFKWAPISVTWRHDYNNNWRIWCVSRFHVNKNIKQT